MTSTLHTPREVDAMIAGNVPANRAELESLILEATARGAAMAAEAARFAGATGTAPIAEAQRMAAIRADLWLDTTEPELDDELEDDTSVLADERRPTISADELECQGHPAEDCPGAEHAAIGEVAYCDGSCRRPS